MGDRRIGSTRIRDLHSQLRDVILKQYGGEHGREADGEYWYQFEILNLNGSRMLVRVSGNEQTGDTLTVLWRLASQGSKKLRNNQDIEAIIQMHSRTSLIGLYRIIVLV